MKLQSVLRCVLLVFGLATLAGCAAPVPSGLWQEESDVQQLFESGQLLPNHTYYYLGSFAAPDSVIAVSNQFTLRSRVWAQVDMTEARLNGWLQWWRTERYGACDYHGGRIIAPDGRQAGVWYSQNVFNIIHLPEPGVIEVYKPHSYAGRTCGEPRDESSR